MSRERPGSATGERIRVFIGSDENQILAARVLEYTIAKHASIPVETRLLTEVAPPVPKAIANRTRTGFTFQRFAIPSLCGFAGRAIYLDADMLVFRDIAELWRWPMTAMQGLLYAPQDAATGRTAQYSVLVIDCARMQWRLGDIIALLDSGRFDYEALVYEFAHVAPAAKAAALPGRWNSLERFEPGATSLIHYTRVPRQPWVYPHNRNGRLWYGALREAIAAGAVPEPLVAAEINAGHAHPDLPRWLGVPIAGVNRQRRDWQPPYLGRLRQMGTVSPIGLAVRRLGARAPWLLRLRDALR